MKKKKRKEKISKILLAVFIVVASYTLLLNILRLYNMYNKIEIKVHTYKEIEEQLSILNENIYKIRNMNEGYYTEEELTKISKYFLEKYNKYSSNILLKNKSEKYNYIEILEIMEFDNLSIQSQIVDEYFLKRIIFKENDISLVYLEEESRINSELYLMLLEQLKNEISSSAFTVQVNAYTAKSLGFGHIFYIDLLNINRLATIILQNGGE